VTETFGWNYIVCLTEFLKIEHMICAYNFTALHGMQTRSSDENSVCPSVRLSHA